MERFTSEISDAAEIDVGRGRVASLISLLAQVPFNRAADAMKAVAAEVSWLHELAETQSRRDELYRPASHRPKELMSLLNVDTLSRCEQLDSYRSVSPTRTPTKTPTREPPTPEPLTEEEIAAEKARRAAAARVANAGGPPRALAWNESGPQPKKWMGKGPPPPGWGKVRAMPTWHGELWMAALYVAMIQLGGGVGSIVPENFVEYIVFLIGILLGVAIYNGVILDMRFPHVLYKKLMRQPLGLRDLKRAFPAIGRSLQALLDFDGDGASVESTFGLCMQVCYVEFGETKTRDLVPGGGEVPVTERNREQYVELYTRYLLEDAVARQFDAFLRGFHAVCGGDCLQLFRWEELELLICGSPFLDFGALERVAQYDDGYSREHPTIALLWEVIHELPLELQKKFLFFATGSDRVPIKGLGNLTFVVSKNGSDEVSPSPLSLIHI